MTTPCSNEKKEKERETIPFNCVKGEEKERIHDQGLRPGHRGKKKKREEIFSHRIICLPEEERREKK